MAFAPHPECARHLRCTSPENVSVIECAVSDREGVATLHAPVVGGIQHHGLASLSVEKGAARDYGITARSLDGVDLVRMPVRFVKIDVEGHDLAAFVECQNTCAASRATNAYSKKLKNHRYVISLYAYGAWKKLLR